MQTADRNEINGANQRQIHQWSLLM